MPRAWVVIALAAVSGCYNQCTYDRVNCPSSSAVLTLDGKACDPDRDSSCSGTPGSCVCELRTGRWRCEASPRTDLAAPRLDMTLAATGCGDYVTCLVSCFQSTVNATVATCESKCAPGVSGSAVVRYETAVRCGESHCTGALDADGSAGDAPCLRAADGELLNEDGTARSPQDPGTGRKRCNLCLHDALAHLYGEACTGGGPDCDPPSCAPAVDACLAD